MSPRRPKDISILVVDKTLGEKEPDVDATSLEEETRLLRGSYRVTSSGNIRSLDSCYDIIIMHPYPSDFREIKEFHSKNSTIPLILYSGGVILRTELLEKREVTPGIIQFEQDGSGIYFNSFARAPDLLALVRRLSRKIKIEAKR